jgi:acetolactate synthase-1/2/3 large subunit
MGKGVINEDSESFLGNAALSSGDFVHRALDAADVIINVGHDVVEKPPFLMQPGGRTVIHVNFTSAEVDPVYFRRSKLSATLPTAFGASAKRCRRMLM